MNKVNINEKLMRDLHLQKLANGVLQGPPTGKLSVDKPWLKFYTEDQLKLNDTKMSIFEYMMKKNYSHPDDIALNYFGKKTSYEQFNKLIGKCASAFAENGVAKGDIVTICMPNTPEAVIAFYALNKIGAVANMIHPLSSQEEVKKYVNEVDSKMILTIDMSYKKICNILNETNLEKIIYISPSDSMPSMLKNLYNLKNKKLITNEKTMTWKTLMKCASKIDSSRPFVDDELALILHTGGTTGISKGVKITNENFNSMVEQFIKGTGNFQRGNKMLTIMPVFHGFGLCSSIHLPLSLGVTSILIPKFSVKNFDKLLKKEKPNYILGVPTLFKAMINNKKIQKQDLSYLEYVVSGGDLIKNSLENDVNTFLKTHNSKAKLSKGYGLSEVVAGATFAYGEYNKAGSVGIPMVSTNLKIVSPETKKELPTGNVGEICIQGPSVTEGYYKNDEETKKSLVDEWLYTGDLGVYKNDALYFELRKGNMIISSGVNVYPQNIERVIEMHEAVATCAVIGISHPYKMEVPKAYIVLKEGYEISDDLKVEIEKLCIKYLNAYCIPSKYEFREVLPETLLGKINHKVLKDEAAGKVKTYKKEV